MIQHCFSLRFTNSQAWNLCQKKRAHNEKQIKTRVKWKIKIKIKHIPQGYAVRHLASWAAFNNLHTDNVCTSAWLCVGVCVCVLCIILLANCPCTWCNSVAHLPLQTRLNPTCAWVPVAFAASLASVAYVAYVASAELCLRCVQQLNLKFLRNPTKHGENMAENAIWKSALGKT